MLQDNSAVLYGHQKKRASMTAFDEGLSKDVRRARPNRLESFFDKRTVNETSYQSTLLNTVESPPLRQKNQRLRMKKSMVQISARRRPGTTQNPKIISGKSSDPN